MKKDIIYESLSDTLEKDISKLMKASPDTPLSELGLTSLTMIAFIVDLEEKLGIEVLDSDLVFENFSTLENLFNTLSKYVEEKKVLKKVLILDADNVLWKGISGEEDIFIDADIKDFQEFLIELYRRGVILCLCSKNDSAFIEESFKHPEMLLKKEHFAVIKANRLDKASNISNIAEELNLSSDSFVFADDSDYELGFVSLNLPEVSAVKVDHASPSFKDKLSALFESAEATSGLNRTELYREQKEREKEKRLFTSPEEYNRSLETEITCGEADISHAARLSELSMRTNQFNLSAARCTEKDIEALIKTPEYLVLSLSVKDKFGDMGMAVVKQNTIEVFMLSCRAFDRGFETHMLNIIKEKVKEPLYGIYRQNGKNVRYSDFYSRNGVSVL